MAAVGLLYSDTLSTLTVTSLLLLFLPLVKTTVSPSLMSLTLRGPPHRGYDKEYTTKRFVPARTKSSIQWGSRKPGSLRSHFLASLVLPLLRSQHCFTSTGSLALVHSLRSHWFSRTGSPALVRSNSPGSLRSNSPGSHSPNAALALAWLALAWLALAWLAALALAWLASLAQIWLASLALSRLARATSASRAALLHSHCFSCTGSLTSLELVHSLRSHWFTHFARTGSLALDWLAAPRPNLVRFTRPFSRRSHFLARTFSLRSCYLCFARATSASLAALLH